MASTLERVRELQPRIRELEGEITENAAPTDLVEDMRGTGVFRMAMPTSWGRTGASPCSTSSRSSKRCRTKRAVGWCAMIGCDSGYYSRWLDDAIARDVFALDSIAAGLTQPGNNAMKVDGGYRVTGVGSSAAESPTPMWSSRCVHRRPRPGRCCKRRRRHSVVANTGVAARRDRGESTSGTRQGSKARIERLRRDRPFVPDEHALYIFGRAHDRDRCYSFST